METMVDSPELQQMETMVATVWTAVLAVMASMVPLEQMETMVATAWTAVLAVMASMVPLEQMETMVAMVVVVMVSVFAQRSGQGGSPRHLRCPGGTRPWRPPRPSSGFCPHLTEWCLAF